MSKINGKNTKPELFVRKILFSNGYRYRIHSKNLPGKPDIFFPSRKKVIFIHGCFWHGHTNCSRATRPKTNSIFWNTKINRTIQRDNESQKKLKGMGWDLLVVWQCQLNNSNQFIKQLIHFIES